MSMPVDQATAMERIVDAAMGILYATRAGIGVDHDSLVRGDRTEKAPQPPALWMWEVDSTPSLNETFRERWQFRLMLVAVVAMVQPVAGRKEAVKILSRAMSALARHRRLGLDYVQDVRKGAVKFSPTRAPSSSKGLFAVSGEMVIEYNIREGVEQ